MHAHELISISHGVPVCAMYPDKHSHDSRTPRNFKIIPFRGEFRMQTLFGEQLMYPHCACRRSKTHMIPQEVRKNACTFSHQIITRGLSECMQGSQLCQLYGHAPRVKEKVRRPFVHARNSSSAVRTGTATARTT